MPDFSIVCCISKPDVYESCLLASLNQNRNEHDIEIIPIINNDNLYSASNALNIGLDVAHSDVVVFAHQDVRLLRTDDGRDWFTCLKDILTKLPNDWSVLGSAGIDLQYTHSDIGCWGGSLEAHTVAVGSVWDSDESLDKPPYWDGNREPTIVHCADECLLVLNKQTGLRFDSMFTGFHFYGVDICLQARAAAYLVHCAYLPIVHYGKYSASFVGDNRYWVYLRYLYNKWHSRFPELLGTHMHWCLRTEKLGQETFYKPEITSYISIGLDAGDDCPIQLKAMGIGKVRLGVDRQRGFVED